MKDYEITIKLQVQASDSISQDDVLRQSSQMLYFDVQTNVYHVEHCKQYDDGQCTDSSKDDFRKQ